MVSENIYEEIVREMMKTNTKEYRRDLQRDLEICERATPGPWKFFENSSIITNETDVWICEVEWNNDKQFIAEAREGWPHAIRRALEAERRVAELEAEVERLRKVTGGIWSFVMERYEKADEEGYMWKNDIYGEILREIERLEKGGNE